MQHQFDPRTIFHLHEAVQSRGICHARLVHHLGDFVGDTWTPDLYANFRLLGSDYTRSKMWGLDRGVHYSRGFVCRSRRRPSLVTNPYGLEAVFTTSKQDWRPLHFCTWNLVSPSSVGNSLEPIMKL